MKRAALIVTIIVILCGSILLAYWVSTEGFAQIQPLRADEIYRIHTEEQVPREELSLFLATTDNLYLYYDYAGLVNVYSEEGIFLYGLQVKSLKHGYGDIAFDEGLLYIKARGNAMYVFDKMKLTSHFESTNNPEAYKAAELLMSGTPCREVDGVKYYAAGNEIVKSENDGPLQTVIRLPKKNESIRYLGIFLLLATAAVTYHIGSQRRHIRVKKEPPCPS